MNPIHLVKPVLAGLSLLSVSACVSVLPESEPVTVYRLSSPEPREWSGGDWVIVEIEAPLAPRGLAGDTIAIARDDRNLAYIEGARWISPAPALVQNLVIDSFNADDARLAPARPEDGTRADYELRLDLRQFEAAYVNGENSAPVVRVRIAARLIAERGRRFVGARVFSADVPASSNRTSAIVAAFDEASSQVSSQIADWSAERTVQTD